MDEAGKQQVREVQERWKQQQAGYCSECSGYTHMPWCSEYEESSSVQYDGVIRHTNEWRKVYHGPSRPMIETGEGNLLSISQFDNGRWNSYEREDSDIDQIVNDHNQHQQCASQLRFLGDRLEAQAKQMAELAGENERLRVLLRGAVSPTHCYCAVMNGKKCWQCEAREALNHAARGEGK